MWDSTQIQICNAGGIKVRIETDLKISKETAKNFSMLIYDAMAKYIVSEKQSEQEIKEEE